MNLIVKIYKKDSHIPLPQYESTGASGMDLRAFLQETMTLLPLERAKIPTGLFFELPFGYEAQIRPRSGLALKNGLTVLNSPGTIDSDYRGEVSVILINLGNEKIEIKNGDRIAQLIFAPVNKVELIEADILSITERGNNAFGSTGV